MEEYQYAVQNTVLSNSMEEMTFDDILKAAAPEIEEDEKYSKPVMGLDLAKFESSVKNSFNHMTRTDKKKLNSNLLS